MSENNQSETERLKALLANFNAGKTDETKTTEENKSQEPPKATLKTKTDNEPKKSEAPKVKEAPSAAPVFKSEKDELLHKIQNALKEYGGESNIPYGHDYWSWLNRFRGM